MTPYSKLRSQPRVSLVTSIPLPAPYTIYVEPTNACNFKCIFCPESLPNYKEITGGTKRLSMETWFNIQRDIIELGHLKTLNFYMLGEPFLNKDLLGFVRLARNSNIADRICITTNGSMLSVRGQIFNL